MRRLVFQLLLGLKTIDYRFLCRRVPRRLVVQGVPYYAQWESHRLVTKILQGQVRAQDDPLWKASGARSRVEYAAWSWSGCGMACLKMILAHRDGTVVPLVTLGKRCAEYGGYELPLDTSIGLLYKPFVNFVGQEFGLTAKPVAVMPAEQIVYELARGRYVMASVNAMIRGLKSNPPTKGGHLVLVVGYDRAKRELYIHNPSAGSAATESYAPVPWSDFQKFFSNRGLVISR